MKKHLHSTTYRLLLLIFLCSLSKVILADDTTTQTWEDLAQEPSDWSTSSTEINITSAEELAWVAKMVNEDNDTGSDGKKGFEDVTITLTQGLDLAGHLWIPIGKDNLNDEFIKLFKGTFDGGNFTISNMTINTVYAAGLFGHIKNATIKNIVLTDCSIEKTKVPEVRDYRNLYIGCIAANSKSSTIQSCTVKGSIKRENSQGEEIGGITGLNSEGTVTDCSFEGSITAQQSEYGRGEGQIISGWVGGIAGYNAKAAITNCEATLTMTIEGADVGGITSINSGNITNCKTKGEINLTSAMLLYGLGGIAGQNTTSVNERTFSIENCSSACNINLIYKANQTKPSDLDRAIVGGITGDHSERSAPIIGCTAYGTITVQLTTDQPEGTDLKQNKCYAGGIAGDSQSEIKDCKSFANITASSTIPSTPIYAGGVVGRAFSGQSITNCTASSNISIEGYIIYGGGITGYNNTVITNCQYNTSLIPKENKSGYSVTTDGISAKGSTCYIGGIAGINYKTIKNNYSTSNIISEASGNNYIGGITGWNYKSNYLNGEVQDCYTTGNILSTGKQNRVGGIVGNNANTVKNCYATSKLEAFRTEGNSGYVGGIVGVNNANSSIENCLGLNLPGITNYTTATGRIIGFNSGTGTNNCAHPEIPGEWQENETINGNDWDMQSYPFSASDAWDFSDDTQLPKLKQLNEDGSYTDMVANQPEIPLLNLQYFTITFDTPNNGTLTVTPVNGNAIATGDKVLGGTALTITAQPNDNTYQLDQLLVNGTTFTSGENWTVSGEITISATFSKNYAVTITPPTNGTITVTKAEGTSVTTGDRVPKDTQLTIIAEPDNNTYKLDELLVNNVPFTSGDKLTVSEDIIISATFSKSNPDPEPGPEPEPTPEPDPVPVYYLVTLPSIEGATTDPVAGDYEIEAWGSFHFYLTLDAAYSQSSPIVTTDRGETIEPRSSDGAYIIKYVRSDLQISIDGIVKNPDPVANESVDANDTKVWAEGAYLHIHTAKRESICIYSYNGTLLNSFTLLGDQTVYYPQGNYIVVAGGKRFKVQVK